MLKFERFNHGEDTTFNIRQIIEGTVTGWVAEEVLSETDVNGLIAAMQKSERLVSDLNNGNGYSVPFLFGELHQSKPKEKIQLYFGGIKFFLHEVNEALKYNLTDWVSNVLGHYFQPYHSLPLPGFLPFSFRKVFAGKGGLYLHQDGKLLPYIHEEVSREIQKYILPETMMSWYFTLQDPQQGGELWVADSDHNDYTKEGQFTIKDPLGNIVNEEDMKHLKIKTPTGSLLMFKGGTHWHKVIPPAEGCLERITMGGFMALSPDETTIYFWS